MPSGAKKRKAAKKKKEKEASINPSTNNPEGTDDSKSQDDKGSDGGSPEYHDHHNHPQPFTEASEELGERDPSSVQLIVPDDKSTVEVSSGVENSQEVGLQEGGGVAIERDLKYEDDSGGKNISVEYVESTKASYDGDYRSSSSSSSSSSDDDFRAVEKKPNKEATHSVSEATSNDVLVKPVDPEDAPAEKTSDSIAEMSPVVDSVKPLVPVSEETLSVLESAPVENSVVSDVIKLGKGAEKSFTGAPITELSAEKVENKVLLDENGKASSSVLESVSKINEDEVLPSSGGPVAQTSNGIERLKDSEIPEYSENQPLFAPAPPVVQRTPWWNCCGIFDVITGSSR